MSPTPATRSWFSRNALTGCLRPRACSRSAWAVKSELSGSTPSREAKYSASASLPSSTSPVPKRRTSTNRSLVPSESVMRTRVCFGSSSASRRLPVIRRCMTRWTSSSKLMTRYLPRRHSRSMRRPFRASDIASAGAGSLHRWSRTWIRSRRCPSTAGSSCLRIVSTSGSSGTHVGSSTWVRAEVHVLQPLAGEVRVELRRRDVRVAQHLLHGAQVAATGQQVRRERVPERVRAHAVRQPRGERVAADDLVEALAGELAAAEVHEQVRLGRALDERGPPSLQIDPERLQRRLADGDDPLLRALAARPQEALLNVHVHQLQADRLGGAQAAGVHHLEQRAIAQRSGLRPTRLRQEPFDLATGEHLRQLARAPRRAERGGGVPVEEGVAAEGPGERPQAGALPVDRRGRGRRLLAVA